MKHQTIILTIAGIISCYADNSLRAEKISKAQIALANSDELIEKYLQMLEVPGAVVGVVVEGEVVFSKTYGQRDKEKSLPVTPQTLFPIGSITKGFTTALLGALVDKGTLHFDDLIAEYVPFFKLQDAQTTYEITIRDYLTHTSGYPKNDALWYNLTLSRADLIRKLRYLEPSFSFRSKFHYQNIGYAVAAYAAEMAAQKSYEDLLKENILQPLGLTATTLSLETFKENKDRATGYRFWKNQTSPTFLVNLETIAPGGGLNSNLVDMLTWTKAILRHDSILEERTWHEIFTPQVSSDVIRTVGYNLAEYVPIEAYGLGWFLVSYRGHFMAFHGGNVEGFSSSLVLFPRSNMGIVVLTNKHTTPFPYLIATILADKLLELPDGDWMKKCMEVFENYANDQLQPSITPTDTKEQKDSPPHPLSEYQGTYYHRAFGKIEIQEKDKLLRATLNEIPMKLNHYHSNTFEVTDDCPYSFLIGLKFSFQENCYGDIHSFEVPLEPASESIIFRKQIDPTLNDAPHLELFTGSYSYYGFSFLVERKNGALTVKAFGQPEYTLIPEKFGVFRVMDNDGYLVQFLFNESNEVSAVQLTQPNSNSYTASRQKS